MLKRSRVLYASTIDALSGRLGLDVDYLVRGGFYGGLQQIVGLTSGLVIAYVFGHYASIYLFGEYNLLLSIVSLFSLLSIPGLNTALLRSVGEGFDSSLSTALWTRLKWSFLAVPFFLIASLYYQFRGSDVLPSLLILAAIFFPFLFSLQVFQPFFTAKKRFDLGALFSSVSSVLTATLVSLAVLLTSDLTFILGGYFLGLILPALVGYFKAVTMAKSIKVDSEFLRYGYFLTGIQLLPTAVGYLSNIMLATMLGVDVLAVYTVATKFPLLVQKNFDVFYQPISAKLANASDQDYSRIMTKHIVKLVLLGLAMFASLWLLAPTLIQLFYGRQYVEAIGLARWYALMILPLPLLWVFNDVITFQKQRGVKLILSTILPIGTLVAYWIAIPKWQIAGLIAIMLAERYVTLLTMGAAVWLKPRHETT
ncbi:MAG: oligosaccharide flippase family protein [Candidatus Chisholmbacteria bacterium]|nr:oligosaccharide flippase family protein [Candidatus Chisholmbacteria bacterium]